ncbi:MAG: AI-2E family transporter [Burkholderiaceae bacterium]|nr:AI-2E family transporter [Burkholderiaceae bacterium]
MIDDAAMTLRGMLHHPSLAGWCLVVLLAFGLLWLAQPFLVVLVSSVALAVLLWPALRIAESLVRLRVVAAVAVLAAACVTTSALTMAVANHAGRVAESVPDALRLAARDIGRLQSVGASTVQRTRSALAELDRNVARVTGTDQLPRAAVTRPQPQSLVGSVIERSTEWFYTLLQVGTHLALTIGAIVLLTFFLLCSGDRLASRLSLWLEGHQMARGRFSPLVSDLAREVRRFGWVTLLTNTLIGLAVGIGVAMFGLDSPLQWAVAAGMLHVVPYAGLLMAMALLAIEVYVNSGSAATTLAAVGYVAGVGILVGQISAVWLQGRASRIDGALMFGGIVFFSMLWGVWGLVLGPLLVAIVRAATPHLLRPDPPAVPAGLTRRTLAALDGGPVIAEPGGVVR